MRATQTGAGVIPERSEAVGQATGPNPTLLRPENHAGARWIGLAVLLLTPPATGRAHGCDRGLVVVEEGRGGGNPKVRRKE